MKNNYMRVWIAFAVASLSSAISDARSMKASDYFEAKPQIALAEAAAKGNTDKIKRDFSGTGEKSEDREGNHAKLDG
jgi:hypothetical protein